MHAPAATPDRRELRRFGLLTGGVLAVLFGLGLPWLFDYALPQWPWIAGGVLAAAGLAHPPALGPVYRGWLVFGHALGWVNTRIILGILFYLVVLPIGMLVRLFGSDPMQRGFDAGRPSYRTQTRPPPKDHFERPF